MADSAISVGRPLDRPFLPRVWDGPREAPRVMYPGELAELLWAHKHSRIYSLGIEANRWGARMREDLGIPESGTLWIVSREHIEKIPERLDPWPRIEFKPAFDFEKNFLYSIPKNGLPYQDIIQGAYFDPEARRMRGVPLARGWRSLLIHLCSLGILRPNEELSRLMGKDSWTAVPRRYWE